MKIIKLNRGKIVTSMLTAIQMLTGPDLIAQLRFFSAQVKQSPTPHHPTGISKARRAARKHRNVLRAKRAA